MTPMALIRQASRMARHLRLNSSISVISRKRRPSCVWASTKLKLQTWLRYSGLRPDTGAAVEPEPGSLGLLLRHFQPLAAPNALYPVLAHLNAARVQQGRHAAVAVPAILGSGIDDVAGAHPRLA